MLTSLDNLHRFLVSLDLDKNHQLSLTYTLEIRNMFKEFDKLKEMIEESIDISKVKQGEYIINPEFNEDLKVLNHEIVSTYEQINKLKD